VARAVGLLAILGGLVAAPAQAFELLQSGLDVEPTPQSVLVIRVEPHSPAARSGLTLIPGTVARVRYINGKDAMTVWRQGGLESAFASDSVLVTLGVRGPDDLYERLDGPFLIRNEDPPDAMLTRLLTAKSWASAARLARSRYVTPQAAALTWARIALEAEEQARANLFKRAIALAQTIPPTEPAYQVVAAQLPYWRTALDRSAEEDRRLLGREVSHHGSSPHHHPPKKSGRPRKP